MRWLAPGADASKILTRRPTECLRPARTSDEAQAVEIGRAAFRSPLLLGGQAARAGVSCETCHRNGRTNRDFHFPGLSGAPGTADVTSFVFSTHRGDHLDDPRPIPDLSGSKTALKIDQSTASPALALFIHGLITEEFDGPEPAPAVLRGLVAYVRALDPKACPARTWEPVTARVGLSDTRRAAAAAMRALEGGDTPTALTMIQAARASLGDMAERFAGPALAPERERLEHATLELASIARSLGQPAAPSRTQLADWSAHLPSLEASVVRDDRSLYRPERLRAALRTAP